MRLKKDVLKIAGIYVGLNVLAIVYYAFALFAIGLNVAMGGGSGWFIILLMLPVILLPNGALYLIVKNVKKDLFQRNQKVNNWCLVGSVVMVYAVIMLM